MSRGSGVKAGGGSERRVPSWLAGWLGSVGALLGLGRRATHTERLGRRGERAAARVMRRAGFRVLGRNVRAPMGEADLVCERASTGEIVIVEVKTRVTPEGRDGPMFPPERAVDREKQRRLARIARFLAGMNGWEGRRVRIDVIAIEMDERGRVIEVRHHEDAVRG